MMTFILLSLLKYVHITKIMQEMIHPSASYYTFESLAAPPISGDVLFDHLDMFVLFHFCPCQF